MEPGGAGEKLFGFVQQLDSFAAKALAGQVLGGLNIVHLHPAQDSGGFVDLRDANNGNVVSGVQFQNFLVGFHRAIGGFRTGMGIGFPDQLLDLELLDGIHLRGIARTAGIGVVRTTAEGWQPR